MREYKAKRKNWHELPKEDWWVYGNLLISDEQYFIVPEFGVCCVEEYKSANTDRFIQLHAYEVDPETLCRDTGLTDKNGKKIFEGDIVKAGENLVVSWKEKFASWCLCKKGWMYNHFFGEAVDAKDCEVIGNIFDNPELLKEVEQNADTGN